MTEHEKYALGATKAGGFASQGFFGGGGGGPPAPAAAAPGAAAEGLEHLATRPPWRCACCGVTCTSRDTLLGHAAGVKHKRRVRWSGPLQPQRCAFDVQVVRGAYQAQAWVEGACCAQGARLLSWVWSPGE